MDKSVQNQREKEKGDTFSPESVSEHVDSAEIP